MRLEKTKNTIKKTLLIPVIIFGLANQVAGSIDEQKNIKLFPKAQQEQLHTANNISTALQPKTKIPKAIKRLIKKIAKQFNETGDYLCCGDFSRNELIDIMTDIYTGEINKGKVYGKRQVTKIRIEGEKAGGKEERKVDDKNLKIVMTNIFFKDIWNTGADRENLEQEDEEYTYESSGFISGSFPQMTNKEENNKP